MTDTPPDQYARSLASSEHLRTLAAMMQQDGIDITFAEDETHGGIPFVSILVQGSYSQDTMFMARMLADTIARQRRAAQEDAERG